MTDDEVREAGGAPKLPSTQRRPPSREARLLMPVGAKAGPMPSHERLGTDDRDDLQDRWKPSIQLDKKPAIVVRKPGPAAQHTPQNDQLMSECRVLCFKPTPQLERRGQDGKDEAEQCKHVH